MLFPWSMAPRLAFRGAYVLVPVGLPWAFACRRGAQS